MHNSIEHRRIAVQDVRDLAERHWHVCQNPECRHAWNHSDSCAQNTEAHKCPKCGEEEWMRERACFVVISARSAELVIEESNDTES